MKLKIHHKICVGCDAYFGTSNISNDRCIPCTKNLELWHYYIEILSENGYTPHTFMNEFYHLKDEYLSNNHDEISEKEFNKGYKLLTDLRYTLG